MKVCFCFWNVMRAKKVSEIIFKNWDVFDFISNHWRTQFCKIIFSRLKMSFLPSIFFDRYQSEHFSFCLSLLWSSTHEKVSSIPCDIPQSDFWLFSHFFGHQTTFFFDISGSFFHVRFWSNFCTFEKLRALLFWNEIKHVSIFEDHFRNFLARTIFSKNDSKSLIWHAA